MHNGRSERITLNGVDYPEKGQAFGKKAKQFTSEMVFGKDVTVQSYRLDIGFAQQFECSMAYPKNGPSLMVWDAS